MIGTPEPSAMGVTSHFNLCMKLFLFISILACNVKINMFLPV